MDAAGNLYGTASSGAFGTTNAGGQCAVLGGFGGCGTVFKLTVPSQVTLSPTSLGFGIQPVTITSAAQSVTLTNSGAAPLSISGITPSGDFAETNNCPVAPNTLAAGSPCTINVTFTPTATGLRTGAITIADNAANNPQSVPLSGTGTDFSVSASPSTQVVTAGKSTTYTLSVAPISGFTGTVALNCSGVPPEGSCTISPTSVSLNGTMTSTVIVTSTTTGKGKKGTPKGTYMLTLTGNFGTLSHSTQVTLTVK
jgi:Abnormal spindle-like microcephaly-assoc'd, ASPM-SPD-2-Hydin